jgi:hypothetical protein
VSIIPIFTSGNLNFERLAGTITVSKDEMVLVGAATPTDDITAAASNTATSSDPGISTKRPLERTLFPPLQAILETSRNGFGD